VCNPQVGYNLDSDVYRKCRNKQIKDKISKTLKQKYASGEIIITHRESPFKGQKNPKHGLKLRGNKISVLISDYNHNPIVTFRGQLDI